MDPNFGGCGDGNGQSQDFFRQEQLAYGYTAALSQVYEIDPNNNVELENTHSIEDAPLMKSQRGANKKVSRRGSAFTKEGDNVICSAFLNVSKDSITGIHSTISFDYFLYKLYLHAVYLHVGVNQTWGGYYKCMHDYFNDHKPEGCVRSQIAVQHRWSLIQKAMNKFWCHKVAVDRLNQRGKMSRIGLCFHVPCP
jgi:hypothetical protein